MGKTAGFVAYLLYISKTLWTTAD